MRIKIKAPSSGGRESILCSPVPCWTDVEVFADDWTPIDVKSIAIHASEDDPFSPITATLEVYVDEIDIECECERKEIKR